MKKYSVRPAAFRDIDAVYEVVANQMVIDFGSPMISVDSLQKKWETINLIDDTLTAFADGELVGYAELLDNDSPFIYLKSRNNVDLAFQLLTLLEQKAVSRSKEDMELFTQISEKNKVLLELYASKGYQSNLSFLMMELKLEDSPTSPQWAEGIHVRPFIPGQDEQAVYEIDEEAAKDKGYHTPLSYDQWVKRMRLDQENFDPGIWFLACKGNAVVGVALNTYDAKNKIVWVDHLSVQREWRHRGIGKALLLQSIGEFHKRDVEIVKLNVDSKSLTNAPKLYESVGMKIVQKYHIYKKELHV
jgi:GNAT superfamily N-acetyltransferase